MSVVRVRPRGLGVRERAIMRLVRHGAWTGTPAELGRYLGNGGERGAWLALASLLDRGAITTRRNESQLRIASTPLGRAMMVRKQKQRRDGGAKRQQRTVQSDPAQLG